MNQGEKVAVEHRGRGALLRGFVACEGFQRRLAPDLDIARRDHGLEGLPNAALQIDQRAVAVEGQNLEIREFHRPLSR